jgi:hypothetical protein
MQARVGGLRMQRRSRQGAHESPSHAVSAIPFRGPVRLGSCGPERHTTGSPTATAMCSGPESGERSTLPGRSAIAAS